MTDSQPTDAKGNALLEVLSHCRSHACFRYPIDGPNEIEKAIDDATWRGLVSMSADEPKRSSDRASRVAGVTDTFGA